MDNLIVIPPREEFTPAQAGRLLKRDRQYIYAAMESGKLLWAEGYEGRRVILRKDLIEFAVNVLELAVHSSD